MDNQTRQDAGNRNAAPEGPERRHHYSNNHGRFTRDRSLSTVHPCLLAIVLQPLHPVSRIGGIFTAHRILNQLGRGIYRCFVEPGTPSAGAQNSLKRGIVSTHRHGSVSKSFHSNDNRAWRSFMKVRSLNGSSLQVGGTDGSPDERVQAQQVEALQLFRSRRNER